MCRCETSEGLPKLVVNFDPALVVVLREVRYFLSMRNPSIDIPAIGLKVQPLLPGVRVSPPMPMLFAEGPIDLSDPADAWMSGHPS